MASQRPVLQKIVNNVSTWTLKLGYKPKAIGLEFRDWVALSSELGHPKEPVIDVNGLLIFLIDGDKGRILLKETAPAILIHKRDH